MARGHAAAGLSVTAHAAAGVPHRIGEVNAHCAKQYGNSFSALTAAQQDEVLRGLDGGKIELEAVRSQFFFNMLLANTLEGFFADPIYGGNRDKAGWKLVGFPGVAAVYTMHVERHGVPYDAVRCR